MPFHAYRIFSFLCLLLVLFAQGYRYRNDHVELKYPVKLEALLSEGELLELKALIPNEIMSDSDIFKIVSENKPKHLFQLGTMTKLDHEFYYRKRDFILKGPVAINIKSGLMWMRCPSARFYKHGRCEIRARGFQLYPMMKMLNDKSMYGYNDWRIANIREISEILLERQNDILPSVKIQSGGVTTTMFDESDMQYFFHRFYLPSEGIEFDRWKNAYFVRGGGAD